MDTLTLRVSGMTCGGCENAVRRTLMKLEGVGDVDASYREGLVRVRCDPTRVTRAVLAQRIESLGYRVEELSEP